MCWTGEIKSTFFVLIAQKPLKLSVVKSCFQKWKFIVPSALLWNETAFYVVDALKWIPKAIPRLCSVWSGVSEDGRWEVCFWAPFSSSYTMTMFLIVFWVVLRCLLTISKFIAHYRNLLAAQYSRKGLWCIRQLVNIETNKCFPKKCKLIVSIHGVNGFPGKWVGSSKSGTCDTNIAINPDFH